MWWVPARRWSDTVKIMLVVSLLPWGIGQGRAAVLISRPAHPAGGLILSSWVVPEGSDSDEYAYDSFALGADRSITEVRWRGGYLYGGTLPNGTPNRATDFRVTIYASVAGDFQPLCGNPHLEETVFLADHWTGANAGETPAGNVGGKAMYDYVFVLPEPFQAKAGTMYWIKIEASQPLFPDWGIAVGMGENNSHYHFYTSGMRFSYGMGDAALTLIGPGPDPYTLADASRALSLWAGLAAASGDDLARLNAATEGDSASAIDGCDAARIIRKAAGLEPNP